MTPEEEACANCARLFRPRDKRHRFCSRNCAERDRYRRPRGVVRPFRFAPGPTAVPTVSEVAWSAGFLDGEAAFQIQVRHAGNCKIRFVVGVGQIVTAPLLQLQRFWGGRIGGPKSRPGNSRPAYDWTIEGRAAADLVRAVRSYLVVKGEQADLMLAYADLPGVFDKGYRLSEADMEQRRASAAATCRLNHRGVTHAA